MTFGYHPAPKNTGRLDQDERTKAQVEKILARKRSRKPLRAKKWMSRGTKPLARKKPMREHNRQRQAKRAKEYAAHLRSAYWHSIRVAAYRRDAGLCQCPDCIQGRKDGVADAFEQMPIWFDTKGKIHGFHTHHLPSGYARFGHERLEDVLTMYPAHHMRLEAKMGYRKRFLAGKK